jgi:Fe-S-cluster formation regulator IscX/YfhJ
MPKVSKDSAEHRDDHGVVEDRHEDIDGYTVNFVSFRQDVDGAPLLTDRQPSIQMYRLK